MRIFSPTVAILAMLIAKSGAGAQQPSTFIMLMGNDTLAVERVTRTANHIDGDFVSPVRGVRVRYAATLAADGTLPRMESWAYRGAADTTGTHVTMQLQGDTMVLDLPARTMRVPTKTGAIVYFNPSMGLLEQAVIRARTLGGQSAEVPLFASEGAATVPLSVTWVGSDSAHLLLGGVAMNVSLGIDGRVTGMAVPAQNVRVVRVEGTRLTTLVRPDYSAPSDAPYTAEDVTVHTPSGLNLTGTLTLPKSRPARGVPAVVTITGSGTEERDESIPGVIGYRPFRDIADTLGRRGIAVLRLDDRGAGGSDAGPRGATSADFAEDIRAALAYLRTRPDIDGERLALVGHSEGGMIAPMVAATDPKLRALVLMAGPAHTGRAILKYQQEYAADSMLHLSGTRRDSALRDLTTKLDSAAKSEPWIHFFLDYDPVATAKRVKQPVLVLQGATDRQVTPEQAGELAAAFRAGGNRDVTMRAFPSTNHLFLADPIGNPSGYGRLPSKTVRADVLGTIADWLAQRLR